jgi:uncharacterized protein
MHAQVPEPRLEPIRQGERIEALDILRGFALFGVFAVNILGFSAPTWVPGFVAEHRHWLDGVAAFLIDNLLTLKSFTLFSFLFGVGFAVQMGRAEAAGKDFASFYPRRLLALLAFGVIHHVFAWEGDILKLYAVLGFALLPFRRAKDSAIIAAAAIAWLLGSAANVAVELSAADYAAASLPGYLEATRAAYAEGGFLDATLYRLFDLPFVSLVVAVSQGGIAFSMFLAGLFVGRRGLVSRLGELRALPRLVLVSGLAGVALTAAKLILPDGLAAAAMNALANGALTCLYASGILLLASASRRAAALAPLAALGRMALTNYALQSVLASIAFYGYGFGLYERIGPAAALGFVMLTYVLQAALSAWWLSRFRFGPLEWLWRRIAYGSPQPFLKKASPSPDATGT